MSAAASPDPKLPEQLTLSFQHICEIAEEIYERYHPQSVTDEPMAELLAS